VESPNRGAQEAPSPGEGQARVRAELGRRPDALPGVAVTGSIMRRASRSGWQWSGWQWSGCWTERERRDGRLTDVASAMEGVA
jgi:hypothetical protein